MLEALSPRPPQLEERAPFVLVRAIRATICELSKTLDDEDRLMDEIAKARLAHGSPAYIQTIARTGHSIFYHQLQALYEFGRTVVEPEACEVFCRRCGQTLTEMVFEENVYSLFQMAMARPGALGETFVSLVEAMLYTYSGHRYLYDFECRSDEVVLEFSYRDPKNTRDHLALYGLDPEECFRNSFEVLVGALETFTARVIMGFDPASLEMKLLGPDRGRLRLPIPAGARFAYEDLMRTLIDYTSRIQVRWDEVRRDEQAETELMTSSPTMLSTWNLLQRASLSDEIILLLGESGTGKSFHAKKIHEQSNRRDGAFVDVCLSAIGTDNLILSDLFGHEKGAFTGADHPKPGLFSLADGGTIFLDEIGDASLELQQKLLGVLDTSTFRRLGGVEDIHVDVRVIAATNRDLFALKEEKKFREDLYYRLNVIEIRLPPLRERREEIPRLAQFLLSRATKGGAPKILPDELAERLADYDWPGNIRELDHALKFAKTLATGDTLSSFDFKDPLGAILSGEVTSRTPKANLAPPARIAGVPTPRHSELEPGQLVDTAALRECIQNTTPGMLRQRELYHCPAHVMYAQRIWLEVLIEECGGDLARIGQYWDRSSEKTIRKLIREYALGDALALARARQR